MQRGGRREEAGSPEAGRPQPRPAGRSRQGQGSSACKSGSALGPQAAKRSAESGAKASFVAAPGRIHGQKP